MEAQNFDTFNERLCRVLTWIIGRSKYSRAQVADLLSARTGLRVTETALYGWTTRRGRHARFPLALAVLLCEILQDFELFCFLLGPHAEKVAQLVREGKGRAPKRRKHSA